MASPPPNPDTRDLPYGWVQQYNWESVSPPTLSPIGTDYLPVQVQAMVCHVLIVLANCAHLDI